MCYLNQGWSSHLPGHFRQTVQLLIGSTSWFIQILGIKDQPVGAAFKLQWAGKHNLQFAAMGWRSKGKVGLLQADGFAYIPAGKAVPDHQPELGHKMFGSSCGWSMVKLSTALPSDWPAAWGYHC